MARLTFDPESPERIAFEMSEEDMFLLLCGLDCLSTTMRRRADLTPSQAERATDMAQSADELYMRYVESFKVENDPKTIFAAQEVAK